MASADTAEMLMIASHRLMNLPDAASELKSAFENMKNWEGIVEGLNTVAKRIESMRQFM